MSSRTTLRKSASTVQPSNTSKPRSIYDQIEKMVQTVTMAYARLLFRFAIGHHRDVATGVGVVVSLEDEVHTEAVEERLPSRP